MECLLGGDKLNYMKYNYNTIDNATLVETDADYESSHYGNVLIFILCDNCVSNKIEDGSIKTTEAKW